MQVNVLTLLFAAVLLFFGQRIYWLFVGAVGFVAGMALATDWLSAQPQWVVLLVAILAGIIGALLAVFFQRLAIGLAGFIAGGHFALLLLSNFNPAPSHQVATVVFIVAGIVAALLAIALLDWALIILSALIGAALIAQWAAQAPALRGLVFVVLFFIGAATQASMHSKRRAA